MKTCLAAKGNILFVELSFISDRFTRHFNFTPYLSQKLKIGWGGMLLRNVSQCFIDHVPLVRREKGRETWKWVEKLPCGLFQLQNAEFREISNISSGIREIGTKPSGIREIGKTSSGIREIWTKLSGNSGNWTPLSPPTVECYFHRDISWREKFITIR